MREREEDDGGREIKKGKRDRGGGGVSGWLRLREKERDREAGEEGGS